MLHEDAIYPARIANIPINIRNTNKPEDPGTMITAEPDKCDSRIISGIAGSKNFTVIAISKNGLSGERGFIRKLAGILEDNDIAIEHLPSGIDTLSVVIENQALGGKLDDINRGDTETAECRLTVETFDNLALLGTVGSGMSARTGFQLGCLLRWQRRV